MLTSWITINRISTILMITKSLNHFKRHEACSPMIMAPEIPSAATTTGVITQMGDMATLSTKTTPMRAMRGIMAKLTTSITRVNLVMVMMIMTIIVEMAPKADSLEDVMTLVMTIGRMIKTIEAAMKVVKDATALATHETKTLTRTLKCISLDLTERLV